MECVVPCNFISSSYVLSMQISCQFGFHRCTFNVRMADLKDGSIQGFLYCCYRINREIMSATHPFAYLSLFFAKKDGKILLLHSFFNENLMNAVNNLKRFVDSLSYLWFYPFTTFFQYATPFHL